MLRDVSSVLSDTGPLRGCGAAVTPGRDGPLLFVAGHGEANRLYARDGDAYVDTATGIVADADRHALGVAAADVDADGCEELYVHNAVLEPEPEAARMPDTDLLLDRLEEDRYRWTDAFALPVNDDRRNYRIGRSVGVIDRYGTGRYGVVVAGYDGPTRFYELGDDGEVTDMAAAVGLRLGTPASSVVAGPLVSDRMDLFVGVENGRNRLFRNESGQFADTDDLGDLAAPDLDTCGATILDEDGEFSVVTAARNGPLRLFRRAVRRPESGPVFGCGSGAQAGAESKTETEAGSGPVSRSDSVFEYGSVDERGSRNGRFECSGTDAFAAAEGARALVAADLDNDGRQELFCTAAEGPNRLFRRHPDGGDWVAVDPGAASLPAERGTGTVVVDLDDDGALELVVVNGGASPGTLAVFKDPDAASRGWLRVCPTTQYGAPARGAVVRLETDEGIARRVVDAGSGYLCQSEPVAHFGLGGATPRRLTVRWPDGRERVLESVDANSRVDVAHPIAPRF